MTVVKDEVYLNLSFTSIVEENRNRWLITIVLINPGRYYVNSPKIIGYNNRFYFDMIFGPPSLTNSFCVPLTYSNTPTLMPGDLVRIQCSMNDSDNNPVIVKRIRSSWQVSFSCEVNKTSPTTETTAITNIVLNDDETFTCEYITVTSGSYNINGKMRMGTVSNIPTQMNGFNVFSAPTSVAKGLVYDWNELDFVPFPSTDGSNTSVTVNYINIDSSW
jgi:hypothetical protein